MSGDAPGPRHGGSGERPPMVEVNLLAPEFRDKLGAMFRWAAEGKRLDEVREQAQAMFTNLKVRVPVEREENHDGHRL